MYDSVVIGVDGNQGGHDAASLARSLASDVAHFTLAYVGMITPVAHPTNLEFELADHDDLPTMLGTELRISGDDVKSVLHQTQRAVAVAPSGHESDPRAITQIGVAVDDEPASEVAIAHAGLLAEHLHARLIPFGVVEPHPYAVGWGTVAVPVEDPASAVTAARERLAVVDGEPVEVVYGPARDELDRFSDRVDLLVCGSRRPGA